MPCREMKQEGEEMRGPSEMAQVERKCIRDVERHGETQEARRSQGPRQRETETMKDVHQKISRDWRSGE